jgi:hypothetical protein
MAAQPEIMFCVLEFHSKKSVIIVRQISEESSKGSSNSEFDQKVILKCVDTGSIRKGKSPGRPTMNAETNDRVQQDYQRFMFRQCP